MNPSQALQGKTVYGAGSHAPTKGRVSANGMQGYLERSMRQGVGSTPVGGVRYQGSDGESDTRSGLAAAALQRQADVKSTSAPKPQAQQAAKTAVNNNQQTALSSVAPTVTVSDTGQVQMPGYTSKPDWDTIVANFEKSNTELAALRTQQQQENLDYTDQRRQSDVDYGNEVRSTRNSASGQGLAFSTAYSSTAVNDANDYQNSINSLLANHNVAQQGFEAQRTALVNQALQAMLSKDNSDSSSMSGYSDSTTPVTKNKKNKKPKKHKHPHHGK